MDARTGCSAACLAIAGRDAHTAAIAYATKGTKASALALLETVALARRVGADVTGYAAAHAAGAAAMLATPAVKGRRPAASRRPSMLDSMRGAR